MKTAISNAFKSMFLCCNPPQEIKGRASFEDIKIDSEISEIANVLKDKMVAEKSVKCSKKNLVNNSLTKQKRSSSKFLSPGMVKMTVARNKKHPKKLKNKKDDNTDEIISAYDDVGLPDDTKCNSQISIQKDLMTDRNKKESFIAPNENSSTDNLHNSLIDINKNKQENNNTHNSSIDINKNKQENKDSFSSINIRPESSFKNDSPININSKIKSIKKYLDQESLDTESLVSEYEPEISCAIDFYDKKEFNRMLLKKIKQSLKKEKNCKKKT